MDPFPPAPNKRPRKLGPTWIGILLAVIAISGVGYWVYPQLAPVQGPMATPGTPAAGKPVAETAAATEADGSGADKRSAAENRSDTILTCTAVNGELFYTNATRCEDADLDNRVNVLDAGPRPPVQASATRECLGVQEGEPRVQQFLAVCMEPFNEALKLERFLLESDDPAGTRAAARYCEYITEGVQAGCMATSAQFCFLDLCQAMRNKP